jgi:hypothetical protein
MYKTAGGSAIIAFVLSSLLSHGGHGYLGGQEPPTPPTDNKNAKDHYSPEADAQKCYAFEALLRHSGLETSPSAGGGHPVGFACDDKAFVQLLAKADPTQTTKTTALVTKKGAKSPSTPPRVELPSDLPQIFDGKILIATVPDPLETSDALEFDRVVAALQEAGATAGYHFELMVTPWLISDLEEPQSVQEGREAQDYRRTFGDEPGAMLFSCEEAMASGCPTRELLFLLAPESPAYGLNMHAAREALSAYSVLMKNQKKTPGPVPWIGPEYSASAASLLSLLHMATPTSQPLAFCVLSGSVSTDDAKRQLSEINKGCDNKSLPAPTFTTLDLDALDLMMQFPAFRENASGDSIAILEEDETAYGASLPLYDISPENSRRYALTPEVKQSIRQFTFPRGIAHVRGLYGKTLRDASAAELARQDSGSADPSMDFSDALQQPMDTGEEFATQSPVSDESILAAISESLTHIHARAVVILATDPLDQLFLARYLHRHVPNTRLVLFNAERLLPRLRGEFDLDGTVVVTRYPLFQDSYLQALALARQSRHSLTFTSSNQEADFLAALAQIAPHPILQQPFYGGEQAPGTWIGISGGGAFWPVAYRHALLGDPGSSQASSLPPGNNKLSSVSACVRRCDGKLEGSHSQSYVLVDTPDEALPKLWSLVVETVLGTSTLHLFLFLTAGPLNQRIRSSRRPWLSRLARHRIQSFYFLYPYADGAGEPDRRGRSELCLGQCWWLINVTILLLLAAIYLLLPAIAYRAKMAGLNCFSAALYLFLCRVTWLGIFAVLVVLGLTALLARLVILYLQELQASRADRRQKHTSVCPLVLSLLWMGASLFFFCCQLADADTGWAFSIRCLHLGSGVCPLLPLLLAFAALLSVAAGNLRLLTLPVGRYTGLPKIEWDALDMESWKLRLSGYADDWIGLPQPAGRLLFAGLAATLLLFGPWNAFATFDHPCISHLYLMTFIVCLWLVLTLLLRFYNMWSMLRFGLESLEGSPLRFAFSRLPKAFSLGPIWSYAGLRRQVFVPARTLEYLRVAPSTGSPVHDVVVHRAAPRLKSILEQIQAAKQPDNLTYLRFNALLNRYAVRLSKEKCVQAAWARGGPDMVSDRAARPLSSSDFSATIQSREDVSSPCGPDPKREVDCFVGVANEYIAVRIVMFVRYYMLHLKNMMTFMSAGTLFLILAAVSYPFNEPHAILWEIASLVTCLLLVVGVALAQMGRDAILSRLSDTKIGKLEWGSFLPQFAAAGGLPALTVLATVFPTLGNALLNLLRPVLETLH